MTSPYVYSRDGLVDAIAHSCGYRHTTTLGGNLSVRESNGDIWIPSAAIANSISDQRPVAIPISEQKFKNPKWAYF